jgi:membrane-bound lytic murein transglycosylase
MSDISPQRNTARDSSAAFQNENIWGENAHHDQVSESVRATKALQASAQNPSQHEVKARTQISQGEQEERQAERLAQLSKKENDPTVAKKEWAQAVKEHRLATKEINSGCSTIESERGYEFERVKGRDVEVRKAIPVREQDVARVNHELEMHDPFGERLARTISHGMGTVENFTKGVAYGALGLPDKGEIAPDPNQSFMKTPARRMGYVAGDLATSYLPIPGPVGAVKGIVSGVTHAYHNYHLRQIEREEKAKKLAQGQGGA